MSNPFAPKTHTAPPRQRLGGGASTGSGAAHDGEAPRALEGLSVLLVEDDVPNARLFSLLLDEAGAVVRTRLSGEAALTAIEEEIPQVMVVDLRLPRMSGLEVVRHVRSQLGSQRITIVAVTAGNGSESMREALEAGCDAYIRKPVNVETFSSTIQRALRGES